VDAVVELAEELLVVVRAYEDVAVSVGSRLP
jgi:hypothetical protein